MIKTYDLELVGQCYNNYEELVEQEIPEGCYRKDSCQQVSWSIGRWCEVEDVQASLKVLALRLGVDVTVLDEEFGFLDVEKDYENL